MLKSNYKLDYFEVLKDEGKYCNHPLERLSIIYTSELTGEELTIKLLTTVEKVWFSPKGYFECYRIEKNETPNLFLHDDGKYILVDVWNNSYCYLANRQQVKQLGCLVR